MPAGAVTDRSRFGSAGTRHIERDAGVISNSVALSASSINTAAIASLSPRLVASSQPRRINFAVMSGATSKRTTVTPCRLFWRHRRVRSAPRDSSLDRIDISCIASRYARLTPAGLPDWPGFHMRVRIAGWAGVAASAAWFANTSARTRGIFCSSRAKNTMPAWRTHALWGRPARTSIPWRRVQSERPPTPGEHQISGEIDNWRPGSGLTKLGPKGRGLERCASHRAKLTPEITSDQRRTNSLRATSSEWPANRQKAVTIVARSCR
jgi:hypothetical protein